MNTKTLSPIRSLGDLLIKWGGWLEIPLPSIFFFGDYEYPKKEDYMED